MIDACSIFWKLLETEINNFLVQFIFVPDAVSVNFFFETNHKNEHS